MGDMRDMAIEVVTAIATGDLSNAAILCIDMHELYSALCLIQIMRFANETERRTGTAKVAEYLSDKYRLSA